MEYMRILQKSKILIQIIRSIVRYGNVSECHQNISATNNHGADLWSDTYQHGAKPR